jgi:hypothetical protein
VKVNPFELALVVEARQPMDFNHPKERKRTSWKKNGIEMGGKHEEMNTINLKNSWEKHKQIMRNKPIRLKNILNLRLVTLCA